MMIPLIMYWSNLYATLVTSQNGPERGPYLTDFDDFGAVGELRLRAFQRHQDYQNPVSIALAQGRFMMWLMWHKDSTNTL